MARASCNQGPALGSDSLDLRALDPPHSLANEGLEGNEERVRLGARSGHGACCRVYAKFMVIVTILGEIVT